MKTFLFAAAGIALLATPALAKRHCVGADGNEIADAANKKECKAKGGKWQKMKKAHKEGAKHEGAAAEHKDAAAAEHHDAAPAAEEKPAAEAPAK